MPIITQNVTIGKTEFAFGLDTETCRIVNFTRTAHTTQIGSDGKSIASEVADEPETANNI